jgi:hypothetical protein
VAVASVLLASTPQGKRDVGEVNDRNPSIKNLEEQRFFGFKLMTRVEHFSLNRDRIKYGTTDTDC